jgi:hypothetical protein
MHPALIAALATFGVQKLRGKSTSKSLRDALMAAGVTYGVGEIGAGIEALGSNTAAAAQAGNLAAQGGTTMEALKIAGTGGAEASALAQMEPFVGSASNVAAGSNLAQYNTLMADAAPLTGISKEIKNVYMQGKEAFGKLTPVEQFGIKYLTAPAVTAAFTPDELPEGMSQEEFMKLDEATRTRLLAEQKEKIKDLGSITQPRYTQSYPYNYSPGNTLYTPFNRGGIVNALPRTTGRGIMDALPKFNEGGINYLPSKVTHDENDVNNYVRATGYVEDGSGNGDKDEDTILAQLADGEFVSRADAVLGAGIMAGASPGSMKDMRAKGAAYFYEQQKRFKRIFDLLDASRKVTTH